MRIAVRSVTTWLTIGVLVLASHARAQQHVADSGVLQQAIASKHATDAANRLQVERVLQRADVQAVATRMGLDVGSAGTALATLTSEELAAVSATAQVVNADLAGGNTITISVTTLLLLIIIIILLAD